jgi:hypothetical protein
VHILPTDAPWTLSWGVWHTHNDMSKEQGTNSVHTSLGECKKEIMRLTMYYKKQQRCLWFANANHINGQSELNLHR